MKGFFAILHLDESGQHDVRSFLPEELTTEKHLIESTNCLLIGYQSENIFADTENSILICGWARIDNRDELGTALSINEGAGDLELIHAAYQKWGNQCLVRLIGDFSFVLVDTAKNTFLLAKDPIGIRPLFYVIHQNLLLISTRIHDLKQAVPSPPEINLHYVARELKGYTQPVEETFFSPIRRLKPAHFMAVSPENPLEEVRYWELTKITIPDCKTEEDYLNRLMTCLITSIQCRIRHKTTVGCQVSGGMDSSAIAVLLSTLMPTQNLHTYSFVLTEETKPYSPTGVDEQNTQEEIIAFAGLDRKNHHPITKFHFPDVFDELNTRNKVMGGLANSDAIWQDTLFKVSAEEHGVEVMFSGFPGDEGISTSGNNYFHEYLHQVDIGGLVAHLRDFRLKALKGIAHYFWGMLHGSTNPAFRKIQQQRNLLHPDSPLHGQIQDESFPFEPSFRRFLKRRMCRPHTTLRTESEGAYANRHGVETVYPLADVRLLQLVYSLPVHLFAPKKYNRTVFRELTKDILPERVRLQPKYNGAKTLAFADYWIYSKQEQLKNYVPKNRYRLFMEQPEPTEEQSALGHMAIKRINFIKEIDYFVEKNSSTNFPPIE